MKILVTGSSGLIGSAAVRHWDGMGADVIGVDNDMRSQFFGEAGSTRWNLQQLQSQTRRFKPHDLDIRDREGIFDLFRKESPEVVIHCAAQPSHDRAAKIPVLDFEVNATGTLNLLEATRRFAPTASFCHLSTNKVYGDAPNELPMVELETRWDYALDEHFEGISEACRIDQTMHSLFGASKTAADVLAQEYGRYYGLNVGVFRGGCLTGCDHSGVELHGFLSYLVHVAVHQKPYTIFGYKGKQVRDQIESTDVVRALEAFAQDPRPGEVYNLGGGRENAASVLEVISMIEEMSDCRVKWKMGDQARKGDHICYISDTRKFRSHYPHWDIEVSLPDMLQRMIEAESHKRDAVISSS